VAQIGDRANLRRASKSAKDERPKPTRSEIMARVHARDTSPELRVRRFLHATGLRYSLHGKGLPGSPDIVFRSRRVVVFVHGCFWHRHPNCQFTRTPKSRIEFWERKFKENVERDARAMEALHGAAWATIVIWECQTTKLDHLAKLAEAIRAWPNATKPSSLVTRPAKAEE
jgi:DNA mismatch endonuclease (patch repair protein)